MVTSYDGAAVADIAGARAAPGPGQRRRARRCALGAYGTVRRSAGPIAVERNQLQRAAHVFMQTEGRDIGSVAADLERALHARSPHRATSSSTSSGRSS